MTCRDEILSALPALPALRGRLGRDTFTAAEVVAELAQRGSSYKESTIRTHVISKMCDETPENDAVTYSDLERVARGTYRLRR